MTSLVSLSPSRVSFFLGRLCPVSALTRLPFQSPRSAVAREAVLSLPAVAGAARLASSQLRSTAAARKPRCSAPFRTGLHCRTVQSTCRLPVAADHASFTRLCSPAGPMYNWSLDTETQLQAAASPRVLRSGQLQRYAASR
jgi:hypothetical protein